MDTPWLSVVLPTYNGARFIRETLNSILIQRDANIEVVVVDDGSTDGTLEIVKGYGGRLPLTIIPCERTANWVAITNLGMAASSGHYVCWLHQDDYWEPGRLDLVKQILLTDPRIEWLFGPSHFVDDEGRRIGMWSCPFVNSAGYLSGQILVSRLCVQNCIATCSPVIKTDLAHRAGPLDEQLWFLADWDYWLRLSSLSAAFYYPRPLSSFRLHAESQTILRSRERADLKSQFDIVLDRHCRPLCRPQLEEVCKLSMELNLALLARRRTSALTWLRLLNNYLSLGPEGWTSFLRDSRLIPRVCARIRAGALSWK